MLVQTTPPAVEPVSLAEAKLHLRVVATDDDTQIGMLITAAREYAEAYTGRSFITQSWRLVLDCFPRMIQLERGPVRLIDSVVYRDMAAATQTLTWGAVANSVQRSSDASLVADLSDVARIAPAFGRVWPIAMPEIGAVAVNYTAGYGNATAVPAGIRQWMLLRIGALYENREEIVVGRALVVAPMPFVDGLLDPYRVQLA